MKPAHTKGGDPRRLALDAKILAWMREEPPSERQPPRDDERFGALALELFEFQFTHCAPYARFCSARGAMPSSVSHWSEIPAVPTGAFKEAPLHSFPSELLRRVFRTSGTSAKRPGELHLDTFDLYEASLLPSISRFVFPDLSPGLAVDPSAPVRHEFAIRVLASPPAEAPHSSLSHMFGCTLEAFGSRESGYDCRDGALQADALLDQLRVLAEAGEPTALCGTSFAFVHLLEAMGEGAAQDERIELPLGSRIMETGGFKGRSREIGRSDLYSALEHHLAIPEHHIVNQYGMTELGSQFYDSVLFETMKQKTAGPRRKLGPAWARVRIVDPESGLEAARGEVGMIVIHDLANTGSIAAIETADLGRRVSQGKADDGFEVLGRFPGAEERGCSIAVDEMWLGDER